MKLTALVLLSATALLGVSAQAGVTTSFGNLSGATFAGTGISSANTEITTYSDATSGDVVTLGLTATPYKVGSVANAGNTFVALSGVSPANANRSTWNFDFYVNINNAADLNNYSYNLAFNDGTTTNSFSPVTYAFFDALIYGAPSYTANTSQDSENIEFFGYNPATAGVYNFDLTLSDLNGNVLADDHIVVDVKSAPDAASTLSMLSVIGAGLAFARRKISR